MNRANANAIIVAVTVGAHEKLMPKCLEPNISRSRTGHTAKMTPAVKRQHAPAASTRRRRRMSALIVSLRSQHCAQQSVQDLCGDGVTGALDCTGAFGCSGTIRADTGWPQSTTQQALLWSYGRAQRTGPMNRWGSRSTTNGCFGYCAAYTIV